MCPICPPALSIGGGPNTVSESSVSNTRPPNSVSFVALFELQEMSEYGFVYGSKL